MFVPRLQTFDPSRVAVTASGIVLTGFAREGIEAALDGDRWDDEAGVDGEVVRRATNDARGTITLHLMQSARDNQVLTDLHLADLASPVGGAFPVEIQDLLGNDLVLAASAWILGPPRLARRRDGEANVWSIRSGNLQILARGSAQ